MENSVELLGYYGGDRRVCLSAWQSTSEELGVELPDDITQRVDVIFEYLAKSKKKSPVDLLNFLAENHHETPFEKAMVDFQITGDIASHIHSLKHRISSINAESARYKEKVADRIYLPQDWIGILPPIVDEEHEAFHSSIRSSEISEFENMYISLNVTSSNADWYHVLKGYSMLGFQLYHLAVKELSRKLGRKRAKESARSFLGYNTQINYDWQMNFRSFVNIQQLRNEEHAQKEIHFLANTMLYLVENIPGKPFEYCLKAFNLQSDPRWLLPCIKNGQVQQLPQENQIVTGVT